MALPITQNPPPRILCGDCSELLRDLDPNSVDLVVTDPPYIARYRDRSGRTIANDDRGAWLYPAFAEVYRVLKVGRFCASFYGWPHVEKFMAVWRLVGFRPVGHVVWRKRYPSSRRFLGYCHEQAFLLAKGEPVVPADPIRDVLDWQYTGNALHPTQKPVSALTPIIGAFSRRGELVLDPFCGSGSTLVAAASLSRGYLGIDIDAEHCETARTRLAQTSEPRRI